MGDYLDKAVDGLLASSLTKLAWLVIVAVALWLFFRDKLKPHFWIGYTGASAFLLWKWTRDNPVMGDKTVEETYSGELSPSVTGGTGLKKPINWELVNADW